MSFRSSVQFQQQSSQIFFEWFQMAQQHRLATAGCCRSFFHFPRLHASRKHQSDITNATEKAVAMKRKKNTAHTGTSVIRTPIIHIPVCSGKLWAKYSPVFSTQMIITTHYYYYYYFMQKLRAD
jgi:hypothetical protein